VPVPHVTVDLEAARRYLGAARELAREEGVSGKLKVADLLALPGVAGFAEPEIPADALGEAALSALDRALDSLEAMRVREGEAIARDLLQRVARVAELSVEIEERSGQVQERARERLRKRARQLESETGLLDEARLHQEVVLAADAQPRGAVSRRRGGRRSGQPGGTSPRVPAPGARAGGEHHRIEGGRCSGRPPGRRAQVGARTPARAGAER
jgi:hypothetical protein